MKPFNLEKFRAGKAIITRDGKTPTEIKYFETALETTYKIYAVINNVVFAYNEMGMIYYDQQTERDLFMASEKKSGWINIYPKNVTGCMCASKEEADKETYPNRLACVKVEWEE